LLYHRQNRRYCQPLAPNFLILRLKTRKDKEYQKCQVIYEDQGLQAALMHVYARTPHYIYYQAELQLSRPWQCRYFFCSRAGNEEPQYLFAGSGRVSTSFLYRWDEEDIYSVPEWTKDAMAYQIFPDRFYNGNTASDPPGTRPWGEAPTRENFFGGDLEGIQLKIPYLKYLGINLIWLNPIFASPSNHHYNTSDYLEIDPALGDRADLIRLVESLHGSGIRLLLDGVFNPTGTDFFAFKDVMIRGQESHYKDWYFFDGFPVKCEPKANYACWWNIPSLPKLKVSNPEVRNYLLSVGTYWLREAGIDGWRLDVPNEIEPSFWREFSQQVKETNPEAYIVGEIWRDARFWLQGKYFDGVMNYLFRELVLNCFARKRFNVSHLDFFLGIIRLRYPEPANFGLLNLLGSHDTHRVISSFQEGLASVEGHKGTYDEAVAHLRPALILQFTYQGIPIVYYGDEIGMTGGPDPDCRGTMPWEAEKWDQDLLALYRHLIALRKKLKPLRHGYFQPLYTDDKASVYAFARRLEKERVIVILNAGDDPQTVTLNAGELELENGQSWLDGLNNRFLEVEDNRLTLTLKENFGAILYRV